MRENPRSKPRKPATEAERLREMLDERGVEWNDGTFEGGVPNNHRTFWGEGGRYAAEEDINGNLHIRFYVTPEQAIEATLGRGTCKPVEQYLDSHSDLTVTVCSSCGVPADDLEDCNFCPNCGAKVVER